MLLSPARACGVALVALVALPIALPVSLPVLGMPSAGAATPPAGTPADRQARDLFQKAEMSFNLGRFPEALADYQAAYQAKPLPPFLFDIAQCYRNMQSYERARFFFRRYLALDPHTANRRMVDDLIAEMTREIDKGNDGHAAAPAAAAAGVSAVGTEPNLMPEPAAAPLASAALAIQSQPLPPAENAHPIYRRWWFWAGAGALIAGAVVVGILATRSGTPQGSLGTIDGR